MAPLDKHESLTTEISGKKKMKYASPALRTSYLVRIVRLCKRHFPLLLFTIIFDIGCDAKMGTLDVLPYPLEMPMN